jgi:hypothetical protein
LGRNTSCIISGYSPLFSKQYPDGVGLPADTLVNILMNLMWLELGLLSLSIIFSNTATLGGWGPRADRPVGELFRLVNTLMAALICYNTEVQYQHPRRLARLHALQPAQPLPDQLLPDRGLAGVGPCPGSSPDRVGIVMSGKALLHSACSLFFVLSISGLLVIYSLDRINRPHLLVYQVR